MYADLYWQMALKLFLSLMERPRSCIETKIAVGERGSSSEWGCKYQPPGPTWETDQLARLQTFWIFHQPDQQVRAAQPVLSWVSNREIRPEI